MISHATVAKHADSDCLRLPPSAHRRRRYESIKYFARLSRELPKIADCLAELGEFELSDDFVNGR
jgi:hypothetical protein